MRSERDSTHIHEATHAERVQMSGNAGMHAVIYDKDGNALEVRSLRFDPGKKAGPCGFGESWHTGGRVIWSAPEAKTAAARATVNAAARQIEARRTARRDANAGRGPGDGSRG